MQFSESQLLDHELQWDSMEDKESRQNDDAESDHSEEDDLGELPVRTVLDQYAPLGTTSEVSLDRLGLDYSDLLT